MTHPGQFLERSPLHITADIMNAFVNQRITASHCVNGHAVDSRARRVRDLEVVHVTFALDRVVPWGRSFDEYCRLFALTEMDLRKSLLGCADGPAAFNCELTRRGGQIVSCDPLYAYSATDIAARINACFDTVLQQARADASGFVWSDLIPDVAALARVRRAAMDEFLADYPAGQAAGRYRVGELPRLPFADGQFDCALCSHLLFLYDHLGAEFHLQAVTELLRVAAEVRIFPLVQLDRQTSPYLQPVMELARSVGAVPTVIDVNYEFQRGGHQMLQIRCR